MALRKFLFINPTEGFHEEQAPSDEISLGLVTAIGVGGIAFDASNNRIINVATPTAASDGVNKAYVDNYADGIAWKAAVRLATAAALPANTPAGSGVGKTLTANANGALSVDGTAVAVGNRILVKNEASAENNGIYVVTATGSGGAPYVLTRATDFDGAPVNEVEGGDAVFAQEGASNADTGWVVITDGTITIDTTAINWTQFTGSSAIIGGAGILKSSNTLSVDLDGAADAQGAGTGGGNSGLEFDVSGDGGKLRVRVNGAGGIQRGASGLELEIDDTPDTLDVGAAGLKVVGVPSLFMINGTAVGANVTAPNLDALTGGASSSADSQHRHNRLDGSVTAEEAIAVADPIFASTTTNDRVGKAVANVDAKARVIGIARTAAGGSGVAFNATFWGFLPGVLSGATVGTPYYLASAGGLATTPPGSNNRVIQCGMALNATDLFVRIVDYGKKV